MALEIDQMLWDTALIVLEGLVLAILLNKWNDFTSTRALTRKIKKLVTTFYTLLKEKKIQDLYYFLKLNLREDIILIQSIFLMDLSSIKLSDGAGVRDLLILENNKYRLKLDPKWESKIEISKKADYFFSKPNESVETYEEFLNFITNKCKENKMF
jgi:hypothetical protein